MGDGGEERKGSEDISGFLHRPPSPFQPFPNKLNFESQLHPTSAGVSQHGSKLAPLSKRVYESRPFELDPSSPSSSSLPVPPRRRITSFSGSRAFSTSVAFRLHPLLRSDLGACCQTWEGACRSYLSCFLRGHLLLRRSSLSSVWKKRSLTASAPFDNRIETYLLPLSSPLPSPMPPTSFLTPLPSSERLSSSSLPLLPLDLSISSPSPGSTKA